MKPGVLCLLLLSACSFLAPSNEWSPEKYALTWYCVSPEGCERTDEVTPIDRVTITEIFYLHFASTEDEAFRADAQIISTDEYGWDCFLLHFLTLFGHELEPSKFCLTPAGFEFELSIPNPQQVGGIGPGSGSAATCMGRGPVTPPLTAHADPGHLEAIAELPLIIEDARIHDASPATSRRPACGIGALMMARGRAA